MINKAWPQQEIIRKIKGNLNIVFKGTKTINIDLNKKRITRNYKQNANSLKFLISYDS